MRYSNANEVLTALAKGEVKAPEAIRLLDEVAKREALESNRADRDRVARIRRAESAESSRLAIAGRALSASPIRPRPVDPIVSDRAVVSAFARNEVSKAQTSAMNCYVIELV
jgi:hypothetical protein